MRLRLAIQRNELPDFSYIFPVPREAITVTKLLELVNLNVPLEGDDWALDDYVVLQEGFECLHYQHVQAVLKDEDEVTVRPLTSAERKARRLSGRTQISEGGAHLLDGVPFNRPLLKRPQRPQVNIPARKRRRLEHVADDTNESQDLAVHGTESRSPQSKSFKIHNNDSDSDDSEDDDNADGDFTPDDESQSSSTHLEDEDSSFDSEQDDSRNQRLSRSLLSNKGAEYLQQSSKETRRKRVRRPSSSVASSTSSLSSSSSSSSSGEEGSEQDNMSTTDAALLIGTSHADQAAPFPDPTTVPFRGGTRSTQARNQRRRAMKQRRKEIKDAIANRKTHPVELVRDSLTNVEDELEARQVQLLQAISEPLAFDDDGPDEQSSKPSKALTGYSLGALTQTIRKEKAKMGWPDSLEISAVECYREDVALSAPPFPFKQYWDPQVQKWHKKSKRKSMKQYYAEEGAEWGGEGLPYDEGEEGNDGQLILHDSQAGENTHEPEGPPPIPQDWESALPQITSENLIPGAIIVRKLPEVSAATGWQPAMGPARTLLVEDFNKASGIVVARLAVRDWPVIRYDASGARIWERFEMPTEQEFDPVQEFLIDASHTMRLLLAAPSHDIEAGDSSSQTAVVQETLFQGPNGGEDGEGSQSATQPAQQDTSLSMSTTSNAGNLDQAAQLRASMMLSGGSAAEDSSGQEPPTADPKDIQGDASDRSSFSCTIS